MFLPYWPCATRPWCCGGCCPDPDVQKTKSNHKPSAYRRSARRESKTPPWKGWNRAWSHCRKKRSSLLFLRLYSGHRRESWPESGLPACRPCAGKLSVRDSASAADDSHLEYCRAAMVCGPESRRPADRFRPAQADNTYCLPLSANQTARSLSDSVHEPAGHNLPGVPPAAAAARRRHSADFLPQHCWYRHCC